MIPAEGVGLRFSWARTDDGIRRHEPFFGCTARVGCEIAEAGEVEEECPIVPCILRALGELFRDVRHAGFVIHQNGVLEVVRGIGRHGGDIVEVNVYARQTVAHAHEERGVVSV